jgi:hypothetical protein
VRCLIYIQPISIYSTGVVLVENNLFRLHKSTLEKQSAVLKCMGLSRRTVEAPLVLDDVKEVDFTCFLWILYPA